MAGMATTVLLAGAVVGLAVRDHTDVCGQPADLPTGRVDTFAVIGLALAVASLVLAIVAMVRHEGPARGRALITGAALVVLAGSVAELGWVARSQFRVLCP
jgi:hypothetical protein